MNIDPYVTLQVSAKAEPLVIKAAYQALMRVNHPDRDGDVGVAARINLAYEILSDTTKRASYDRSKSTKEGTVIGNYRVLEQIAEGGFGVTYKGEQIMLEEAVCIKHCPNVSAAHDAVFLSETKSLWNLRHHALPAVRDLVRLEDGSLALIMSYITGPTLEQIVDKVGRLDAETVSWITDRILNALLYLHHHGVVHGDIKPQNIIVDASEHAVYLVDFGLAMTKPTSSSKSQGYTPWFAPPEQIDSKVLLPASDLYSLGMLMIYGFGGLDSVKLKRVPSTVPDEICHFIKKLTNKDVMARPQTDVSDEFRLIRQKVFGRMRSGMKPIEGLV